MSDQAAERIRAARLACESLAGELAVPSTCDLESCLYRAERVVVDLREALAVVQKTEESS